jgi:hypothetical protein
MLTTVNVANTGARPGTDAYVACRMSIANNRQAADEAQRQAWLGVAAGRCSDDATASYFSQPAISSIMSNLLPVGKYIASEFLGSLETDVFEVAPGQYVHVEQHRHAQDHIYKMGDRETLCWNAEAAVLLEDSRRPESLDAA